jgi:uncharacterized protein (DUF1800 family)
VIREIRSKGDTAVRRLNLLVLVCATWIAVGCATVVGSGYTPTPTGPTLFTLTVSPGNAAVQGDTTEQFTAKTSDGSNPALNWTVNGVTGGNTTVGTISTTGLFTAPEFPPSPNTITVAAAETNNSNKSGSASVTLENPTPLISTVSPMSIPVGAFTLTISGQHFAQGATVNFGSGSLNTTWISSTQLTATGTATSGEVGNVAIAVSNPNPGTIRSGAITAQVRGANTLGVSISPASGSVRVGSTQQFVASVTNSGNTGVSWSVNGIPGGNATLGTIVGNGAYTAPPAVPSPNTITVAATSVADNTQSASSAISLLNPLPVETSVSPTAFTVGTFTITVDGSGFVNGAVVYFGSSALTTTFVSATQLTATGNAVASQAGSVPVTVKNPNPGSAVSGALMAQVTVPNANIKVVVSPASTTLRAGMTQAFTASVTGTTNTAVTWAVNNILGGDAQLGTIDVNGNYLAPDNLPSPNPVTVSAISSADTTKTGNSAVSIQNPVPVLTSATPGTIGTGAFQISLNGSGFVNTSTVSFGGLPLTVYYASPTLITAVGNITATGDVTVTISNPNPGAGTSGGVTVHVTTNGANPVSPASAVRFLEQSSFGPNAESLNQVQSMGFDFYLQNQFAAPLTAYRNPTETYQIYNIESDYFLREISMGDQLRGRNSLFLNELWVVGSDKISDPLGFTNYLRTLDKDAFGNYLDIMKDVTLTPAMGHYLDMVNNDKPAIGQHANENYAREIMQLFTLGLNQLNIDGTAVLDGSGNPVPAYTQDDVMALGLAFTGWTYPTEPGAAQQKHNPEYYGGTMVSFDANHDVEAKTLLGQSIPAGQGAQADLDAALGIIFNHPNVGPFVAKQLILRLVSSNPTPGYVQRVATAFNSGSYTSGGGITYGSGNRGDMQATVAAVVLDAEARQGDSATTAVATDGKLREPIIMEASIARAFHAQTDGGGFSNAGYKMEQNLFYPPTVFNYFPPVNAIEGSTLNGPEFAIFDSVSSIERMNFINNAVNGAVGSDTHLDLSPVMNAGSPAQMIDWLNTLFLHGTMPDAMNTIVLNAVNAVDPTDTKDQAKAAIYLVTSSSMYQVQH